MAGTLRLAPRFQFEFYSSRRRQAGRRTLIVGAGDTGEALLRELRKSAHMDFEPVGLIDDDREKVGRLRVALVEQTSFEEWKAEHMEVIRADGDPRRDRLRLTGRRRRIFQIEVVEVVDVARRPSVGERHAADARNRSDAAMEIVPEGRDSSGLRVLSRRQQDQTGEE